MYKLWAIFFLLICIHEAQSSACPLNDYEKEKKFKSICSLENEGQVIELIYGKEACEFPASNRIDCAYVITCNGTHTRRSGVVFRKGSELNDFCLTAKTIDNSKVRLLVQGKNKKSLAYLLCPVKNNSLVLNFKIGEKTKKCNFSF